MTTLGDNPAFGTYALCSAILALKMLFSAVYTGAQRQRTQAYANPEDAATFGKPGARTEESPRVAHALRIQGNDLENIPAFFAIGLIYVLAGASAFGAAVYCWTFTVVRIFHTVAYTYRLQPWRAASFGIGALCMLGMITQIVLGAI